jgi:hypothetical protein
LEALFVRGNKAYNDNDEEMRPIKNLGIRFGMAHNIFIYLVCGMLIQLFFADLNKKHGYYLIK